MHLQKSRLLRQWQEAASPNIFMIASCPGIVKGRCGAGTEICVLHKEELYILYNIMP